MKQSPARVGLRGTGEEPLSVYEHIRELLQRLGIACGEIDHPAVSGCEDSLRFRQEAGWVGASSKCVLFHARGRYYLVVTKAEKEIVARMFKKEFGTKDIRFAKLEELTRWTGCEPGAVSPFGHVSEELPYYVDEEIFRSDYFMFNPAVPTRSMRITTGDLRRLYAALPNPVRYFSVDEEGRFSFRGKEDIRPA
jgi:prolyl-tRNA editing enzyme YbaK/EbsC (Cys-tRNA(Pro) deacylase)